MAVNEYYTKVRKGEIAVCWVIFSHWGSPCMRIPSSCNDQDEKASQAGNWVTRSSVWHWVRYQDYEGGQILFPSSSIEKNSPLLLDRVIWYVIGSSRGRRSPCGQTLRKSQVWTHSHGEEWWGIQGTLTEDLLLLCPLLQLVAEYLTKTHGSTHSIDIGLKNVFKVERDGEDGNEEVMEQIGNRWGIRVID